MNGRGHSNIKVDDDDDCGVRDNAHVDDDGIQLATRRPRAASDVI